MIAQSARAVDNVDCFFAEGWDPNKRVSWIYDNKQSDGEVPVMLRLWGMRSIPSLQLLPGPLESEVVAPDMVLSMGQIELNRVFMQNCIVWNGAVFVG